jgi:hypothetical protein
MEGVYHIIFYFVMVGGIPSTPHWWNWLWLVFDLLSIFLIVALILGRRWYVRRKRFVRVGIAIAIWAMPIGYTAFYVLARLVL